MSGYLAVAAFHTVYLCNRTALRLEPMVALRSLIWFSRVHGAEPLLFHSMMFVVRIACAHCCTASPDPRQTLWAALQSIMTLQSIFVPAFLVSAVYTSRDLSYVS